MHYTADLFMRGYFGIGITLITFISNLNAFEKKKCPEKKNFAEMVGNSCSGKSDPIGEPTAESFPLRGSSCANLGFEAKQLADGGDGCAGSRFA